MSTDHLLQTLFFPQLITIIPSNTLCWPTIGQCPGAAEEGKMVKSTYNRKRSRSKKQSQRQITSATELVNKVATENTKLYAPSRSGLLPILSCQA
jgi:hypothetical protein